MCVRERESERENLLLRSQMFQVWDNPAFKTKRLPSSVVAGNAYLMAPSANGSGRMCNFRTTVLRCGSEVSPTTRKWVTKASWRGQDFQSGHFIRSVQQIATFLNWRATWFPSIRVNYAFLSNHLNSPTTSSKLHTESETFTTRVSSRWPRCTAACQWQRFRGALQDATDKVIFRNLWLLEGQSLQLLWRVPRILSQFLVCTTTRFKKRRKTTRRRKRMEEHVCCMPFPLTCSTLQKIKVWGSANTSNIFVHNGIFDWRNFNKTKFSWNSTDLPMTLSVNCHWFGSSGLKS